MLAIELSGADVFGLDANAIFKALRGLAQDNARIKLEVAPFPDVTDSTTGTAGAALVAVVSPPKFIVTATDAAPKAAFDTATVKLAAVAAEFADYLNEILAAFGLPLLVQGNGVVGTAGTLAALDKALTAVDGVGDNAVAYATGIAEVVKARNDQALILRAINEISVAIGDPTLQNNTLGSPDKDTRTLSIRAATAAAVDGTTALLATLADTTVDAALLALANNYASMAKHLNDKLAQAGFTDLTDNSGGDSGGDTVVVIDQVFTLHQDDTTNSAPKAAFDTEIPKLRNNFAVLTSRVNELLARNSLAELIDGSGGTVNLILEVIDDILTAVNGVANVSLAHAGTQAIFGAMSDNIATLVSKVNTLVGFFGIDALTDDSAGTASGTDIVSIALSGAGVDNGAAATGIAAAELDAALDDVAGGMATLAAKLNEMTGVFGAEVPTKPLNVVAVP